MVTATLALASKRTFGKRRHLLPVKHNPPLSLPQNREDRSRVEDNNSNKRSLNNSNHKARRVERNSNNPLNLLRRRTKSIPTY